MLKLSHILIPAIFAIAYGSFVFSRYPDNKYSSLIGCLHLLGYTQLEPKKIKFFILFLKAE